MRRLILKLSLSLDGFVAGPNGELDWLFRSSGPQGRAWVLDTIKQAGLHLMGSQTFRTMAAHWPTDTTPFAAPMNRIPKVVFTRHPTDDPRPERRPDTPTHHTWAAAEVARGDLSTEIHRLKSQSGPDLLAHGGATFARELIRLNLIDEYRLLLHPVLLGAGLPLFPALESPRYLTLHNATTFPSGVAAHVYHPA